MRNIPHTLNHCRDNTKRILTDVNTVAGAAKKPKKVKSITKKELNDKIKYASQGELESLLLNIFKNNPEALKALEWHTPDSAALVPLANDKLLQQCFHCKTTENIHDIYGVKICSVCHTPTLTRDQVMQYFGFKKPQADKIKRRTGNGMYSGVKYIYDADTVVKVTKRDGSLFTYVARSSGRSPPNTGEALKAALTKARSDESFLKFLLKQVVDQVPELKQVDGVLASFVPSKIPIKPAPNDPLLQKCFICHTPDSLQDFYDIKVCAACNLMNAGKHPGTLTRDRVMSYFHCTKKEADAIPGKTSTGRMYRSMIYVYSVKTVMTAAKKKHGSLYNMVKEYSYGYM